MERFVYLPTSVVGGSVTYPPGGTFGPRVRPTYELVMIHSGRVDLTVDGDLTRYEAGNTIFLTPGHLEYFQFATDRPTLHSWIQVGYNSAHQSFHMYLESLPCSITLSKRMIEVTREIDHWSGSKHLGPMLQAIGHYAIALYITEAQGGTASEHQTHETVMLAERYIRLNYKSNISLLDLATYASVSSEHLCRLYKHNLGKSPMTRVWEVRTENALQLLASTGLSVAEVADRCGFRNPVHLYQRVKDKTGLSPTGYRKSIWAVNSSKQSQIE